MRQIKAVIFDADGMVIIGTTRFSDRFSQEFAIVPADMMPFFEGEFKQCLIGKADLKEVLPPYLAKWKWEKPVEELLHYWFTGEDRIDKRVMDFILRLRSRGISCYLATNQEIYRTEYLKNQMGFSEIFDAVFSSAGIGFMKPQAEFYEWIGKELSPIKKEEILFWDDASENVAGAKRYGFNAERYTDFVSMVTKVNSCIV